MSFAVLRAALPLAAVPFALLPIGLFPAQAATPVASEAFVPFTPPSATSVGGESLSGLGGAETFDPVGRAQLLAGEMPLVWSGTYQSFDNSQIVSAELRLASVKPMGQMIDLRGELTVGGVTTPVQGNLNAKSDQLDLLVLGDNPGPGLEPGGQFLGLQGLSLGGWIAPRLTDLGGRLQLSPVLSTSPKAEGTSAVRGLW